MSADTSFCVAREDPSTATSILGFWEEVERHSKRHSLHTHRYFQYLLGNAGDLQAVKTFSEQFYLFCVTFHQCLGGLISCTNDQRIIAMISENLFDEMGRGNLDESHIEILKRFSRSIGYTESDIMAITPLPATVELNDRLIEISRREFFLGIGAVGLGAEFAGEQFFRNVYDSFSKKPFLRNADTEIYKIHAQDDTRHRADMKEALSALQFSKAEECRMLFGIHLSDTLFHNFWEGVGQASGFYTAILQPVPTFKIN